jgi:hypothetical protein
MVDGTQNTGCDPGETCVHMDDTFMCQSASPVPDTTGMLVAFCHAGACKVSLAPHYELEFKVDWSECMGSHADAPLTADAAGVMLWPTALVDLAIPLANSGWICKLPPTQGTSECIVSASYSSRELYIWGPAETGCNFLWRETPDGIDAALGAGCGMCQFEQTPERDAASYAFNMGTDTACRCPKVYFAAVPAKPN